MGSGHFPDAILLSARCAGPSAAPTAELDALSPRLMELNRRPAGRPRAVAVRTGACARTAARPPTRQAHCAGEVRPSRATTPPLRPPASPQLRSALLGGGRPPSPALRGRTWEVGRAGGVAGRWGCGATRQPGGGSCAQAVQRRPGRSPRPGRVGRAGQAGVVLPVFKLAGQVRHGAAGQQDSGGGVERGKGSCHHRQCRGTTVRL